MVRDRDFSNVINYYDQRLTSCIGDHQKVGWGSIKSQEKRYNVLLEIGVKDGDSILDVGCGVGDFYAYSKSFFSDLKYKGVDINPNAILLASKKYPDVDFEVVNLIDQSKKILSSDYVFSSGAMTVPVEDQDDFIFLMISKMYELACKGIAINFLSIYADQLNPDLYYVNPSKLLDICLSLSRKVIIRHDYFTHDVTAYIYKSFDESSNNQG